MTEMNFISSKLFLCIVVWSVSLFATWPITGAAQQLPVSRIELMPDLPSPYLMRDWDKVAAGYDSLVFDTEATGDYLPLVSLGVSGLNYPEIQRIEMDSYVGWDGTHGEAINVIPAIVGATLMGINKSAQNGVNWVANAKDYFNIYNGQDIYLNNSSASTGGDWWYETMPNVFFYQMYDLYPEQPDFSDQFKTVADRWLEAVQAMGGSAAPWKVPGMNYRAWNFSTMTGLSEGVKEPEAAGAIAWILYHAYAELGDTKYLHGATQALDFLNEWDENPSYELQLPYGILTAAKLNALHGANYDLDKMLNWCFNRGALRGWGTIVGTWDGNDISGLIGEANDSGNDYAFVMNGYQHASAFAPMVKYDKRYARAIAKWILNVSNASRLFYSKYVDANHQSDFGWSSEYDPNSYIAYESLKESWNGQALYARGDSKDAGWAQTNLALYGSSHVGYLAAVVDTTDIPGILDLDLNATDFLSDRSNPTHLFYNPHSDTKLVTINIGNQSTDIYDAITEQVIKSSVSGAVQVNINGKDVLLLTYLPTEATLTEKDGKLWLEDVVVDHHYGYDFTPEITFKALAAKNKIGEVDVENTMYASIDSVGLDVTYKWSIDGVIQASAMNTLNWTPEAIGVYNIHCEVTSGSQSVIDSLAVNVVDVVPVPPIIEKFESDKPWYLPGEIAVITCLASDPKGQDLTYSWMVDQGEIVSADGLELAFRLPEGTGVVTISCIVSNTFDLNDIGDIQVFSTENSTSKIDSLIYLPFSGNAVVFGTNSYEVETQGLSYGQDAKGDDGLAVELNSTSDKLTIHNDESLGFGNEITVSFWLNFSSYLESEQFVVSHGSWQNRWKISIIPDGQVRWTINTTEGIADLDTKVPLKPDQFYHVAAVYTGNAMALYLDGELRTFKAMSGTISSTSHGIAIGRQLPSEDSHTLKGVIDELKIYDHALGPDAISKLPASWADELRLTLGIRADQNMESAIQVYPNPLSGSTLTVNSMKLEGHEKLNVSIYNSAGKLLFTKVKQEMGKMVIYPNLTSGIYLLKIESAYSLSMVKLIVI